jgi:PilZ domain
MERRRRVPRVSTPGWSGTYSIEGDGRECKVIDISVLGIGIELYGDVPQNLVGRRLDVQVQAPVGESVSIHLTGTVKNTGPGPEGGIRAGLEFVGLSETEQAILKVMELMKVAW